MTDRNQAEQEENAMEGGNSTLKHQIVCGTCGMVYEIRYISEHCRKVEGEGYLCMNCNAVLDLEGTD